jgi:hypothetical protein
LTALPSYPATATRRRCGARAAREEVAATVARGSAGDPLRRARRGHTRRGVRISTLAGHAAAAAGLRRRAGSAVDLVAASVTRGPAGDALRGARLRLAAAAVGIAAVPEYAAAAARLRRGAGAAAELIAAAVAGRPAGDPL